MPEDFISNYKAKHQHPLNRLLHTIGIPTIIISYPLFFFNWRWALALFVFGWLCSLPGTRSKVINLPFSRTPFISSLGQCGGCGK